MITLPLHTPGSTPADPLIRSRRPDSHPDDSRWATPLLLASPGDARHPSPTVTRQGARAIRPKTLSGRASSLLLHLIGTSFLSGSAGAIEPIGFNCGGAENVLGGDNITYNADAPYYAGSDGGFEGGRSRELEHWWYFHDGRARERRMYLAFRQGPLGYHFAVDPGEAYELILRFAEFVVDGPEQRLIDIHVDGTPLIEDLDLYDLIGKDRNLEIRRVVAATDSVLDVELIATVYTPVISGIAIRPIDEAPERLPAVLDLSAVPTYEGTLVTWSAPVPDFVDGYKVTTLENGQELTSRHQYLPWAVLPSGPNLEHEISAHDALGRAGEPSTIDGLAEKDPDDSPLPLVYMSIETNQLRRMEMALPEKLRVPVTVEFENDTFEGKVNFRGNGTLRVPKKSYKIRISGDREIAESSTLNLSSMFRDDSMIREASAHGVMTNLGLGTYAIQYWRLILNHEYAGVFLGTEEPNTDYLERIGLDPEGRCYKIDTHLVPQDHVSKYIYHIDSTTSDDSYRDDIVELVQELDRVPEEDLEAWFRHNFELDTVIDWYAAQVFLGNADFGFHNYLLYRDPETRRWTTLPWDVDGVLFSSEDPANLGTIDVPNQYGGYNQLMTKMLSIPSLMRRYLDRLEMHMAGPLDSDEVRRIASDMGSLILDDTFIDPHKFSHETNDEVVQDMVKIGTRLAERHLALRPSIEELRSPAWADLQINEIVLGKRAWPRELSDRHTIDSVELHYRGLRPLDANRLYLTNDIGDPTRWRLPAHRFVEGEHLAIPISSGGVSIEWVGLFLDEDSGPVLVDSTHVTAGPPSIGRFPDGSGRLQALEVSTPGEPNRWSPPVELLASCDSEIIRTGDEVRIEVQVTSLWRPSFEFALEGHLRGEGGVSVYPVPVVKRDGPQLESGERWNTDLIFRIPSKLPKGRLDLALEIREASGLLVATTMTTLFNDGGPLGSLILNEFSADNNTGVLDNFGEREDWVELLNPTGAPIPLAGYFLTDDFNDQPLRWALPDMQLAPGNPLLIWLDNQPEQGSLHASFKLSRRGEELAIVHISDADTTLVDFIAFGQQEEDYSLGRFPDGRATWERFARPHPGKANSDPDLGPWH